MWYYSNINEVKEIEYETGYDINTRLGKQR